MHIFWNLFQESSLLWQGVYLLQLAFTIWMAVDVYRGGAEQFWIWIIIIFQPLGPWVYFFAVKLRNMRVPGLRAGGAATAWERKLSLPELQYRVERSPTVANRLALAHRLMDKGLHEDAIVSLAGGHMIEDFSAIKPEPRKVLSAERKAYIAEYTARIAASYLPQADGKVLLKFPRIFIVAVK